MLLLGFFIIAMIFSEQVKEKDGGVGEKKIRKQLKF